MSRRTKAGWAGVLVVLVVAAGAWLLWPRQRVIAIDDPLVRAGRFAPSSAVGVAHFNVKRIVESIDALLEEKQASERERREAVPTVLRKIDSVDAYQLGTGKEPNLLVAFYGDFGAEDIAALARAAGGTGAARIQKGMNGRYQVHLSDSRAIVSIQRFTVVVKEFVLILGDEADDLPGGMALAGLPVALTPEFLKTLGKASNKTLPALLKGLDPSADVCVAIGPGAAMGQSGPRSVKASLFLLSEGASKIEALLDSPEAAREVAKEIEEYP